MPSKPYTFTPSTAAKADEVNANFDTLYSALNTDYVTRYSADFLAVPTCTDPPTVGSQLANKQYVDQRAPDTGILAKYVSTSNVTAAGGGGDCRHHTGVHAPNVGRETRFAFHLLIHKFFRGDRGTAHVGWPQRRHSRQVQCHR